MAFDTLTVRELKALLADHDDDAKVVFASNYGDRCRTQQAHKIRGRIEEVALVESGYSDSGYAVAEDDDDLDDDTTYLCIK